VPPEAVAKYGPPDTAVARTGKLSFVMRHTFEAGSAHAIRVQDIMVRDIVFANQWKRPICFAVTCSPDCSIGLDDYLWFHGLVRRLEPRKINGGDMGMNRDVLEKNLLTEPVAFSKEPEYGFKFRGIADTNVVFDENTSRLMLNYRIAFMQLSMYYVNVEPNPTKAVALLERMEHLIPRGKIPMPWELMSDIANIYNRCGRVDRYNEYANELEKTALQLIAAGRANAQSRYNPYRLLLDIYDTRHESRKALDLLIGLQKDFPNDAGLNARIQELRQQVAGQTAAEAKVK